MTFSIRPAHTADAEQISAVKQTVWPEEPISLDQINQALSQSNHRCYVALVKEKIVGFMDCFMSTSGRNKTRLEMDLLAVLPEFRGNGIAAELIRSSLHGAISPAVDCHRALIQIENSSSQKAFQKNGFRLLPELLTLYVTNNHGQHESAQHSGISGYLLPVITLGYSGYWIEPPFSTGGMILPPPFQTAGALLPLDGALEEAAVNSGFEKINQYQWWVLPTKS